MSIGIPESWDEAVDELDKTERSRVAMKPITREVSMSAIDVYRQHFAARQLYIDKCAVVRSELDSMDQQAVESIVHVSIDQDLSRIDAVLSYVMDTLESDGNKLHRRRKAFEKIQDLYEPDQLMGLYANSKPKRT